MERKAKDIRIRPNRMSEGHYVVEDKETGKMLGGYYPLADKVFACTWEKQEVFDSIDAAVDYIAGNEG